LGAYVRAPEGIKSELARRDRNETLARPHVRRCSSWKGSHYTKRALISAELARSEMYFAGKYVSHASAQNRSEGKSRGRIVDFPVGYAQVSA
jgi:hypothetical protein